MYHSTNLSVCLLSGFRHWLPVLPEYREARLDLVRDGVNGEEQRQVEFLAKADMAYRKVWRTAEKGLKRKKGVW